ncbi:MAG: hypothetical protein GEU98_19470 [Pseudonocardiaceae bacterium]|nr:hypothetical protein [Pseudonocardiaceae bacterium]
MSDEPGDLPGSPTPNADFTDEQPVEDSVDQQRPVDDDQGSAPPRDTLPFEAPEADAAEQASSVAPDEDEYR